MLLPERILGGGGFQYPIPTIGSNLMGTVAAGPGTNATFAADRLYAWPYFTGRTISIDRMQALFVTGGSAGSLFRMGFAKDNGSIYPGDTILDSGDIDGTPTTVRTLLSTVTELEGEFEWLLFQFNSVTTLPLVRTFLPASIIPVRGSLTDSPQSNFTGYIAIEPYGPFPATYPLGAGNLTNVGMPAVGVRRVA